MVSELALSTRISLNNYKFYDPIEEIYGVQLSDPYMVQNYRDRGFRVIEKGNSSYFCKYEGEKAKEMFWLELRLMLYSASDYHEICVIFYINDIQTWMWTVKHMDIVEEDEENETAKFKRVEWAYVKAGGKLIEQACKSFISRNEKK